MAGWRSAGLAGLAALAAAAGAAAQTTPQDRAREAAAMLTAAGFRVQGSGIANACGHPTQPKPAAADLNGDGRPEAVITDVDPACYGGTGEAFSLIQRQGPANWTLVGAGRGRIKLLQSRTNGWLDWSLEGPGCQRTWTYQPGQGYLSLKSCPGETTAARPAAAAPAGAGGSAADRAAAFRAAGFPAVRGKHPACDKQQEATIEVRDLNGDSRPDAVVSDFGTDCYGSTEQGFVIVTRDAGGAWRKFYNSPGIPSFQAARGVGGWPDVEVGGPGFCHPVMRWTGSDYATIRWRAENPGACKGQR